MCHVPMEVNFSSADQELQATCKCTKIWSSYLYPFESYGGVPLLKFRSRGSDHAYFRGQFVVRWLQHVTLDVFTK